MRKYKNYKELLNNRSSTQLRKALEIQKRVIREREQEERMKKKLNKRMVNKVNFLIKTNLISLNEKI